MPFENAMSYQALCKDLTHTSFHWILTKPYGRWIILMSILEMRKLRFVGVHAEPLAGTACTQHTGLWGYHHFSSTLGDGGEDEGRVWWIGGRNSNCHCLKSYYFLHHTPCVLTGRGYCISQASSLPLTPKDPVTESIRKAITNLSLLFPPQQRPGVPESGRELQKQGSCSHCPSA